jgi:hypothetical protein
MNLTTPLAIDFAKERAMVLAALATALEHAERGALKLNPDQYQALVKRLKTMLQSDIHASALEAVLAAHPATAELYENLHYERSGLLRSPIDQLVMSEWEASGLLARVAGKRPGAGLASASEGVESGDKPGPV